MSKWFAPLCLMSRWKLVPGMQSSMSSVKALQLMQCCRFTLREANKTSEFSLFESKQYFIYLSSTVGTGLVTKILEYAQ